MKCLKIWFTNGKSRNIEDVQEQVQDGNTIVISSSTLGKCMVNWDNVSMIEEYHI